MCGLCKGYDKIRRTRLRHGGNCNVYKDNASRMILWQPTQGDQQQRTSTAFRKTSV